MKKNIQYIFGVLLLTALAIFIFKLSDSQEENLEYVHRNLLIDSTQSPELHKKYGFSINDFFVIDSKIKRNESISDILNNYNVSQAVINEIANKSRSVFDVRRFRTGNKYTILFDKDDISKAEYFIYENNKTEYVVFDIHNHENIYKGEKLVIWKEKTIAGDINSSLWLALKETGASPLLAVDLADVYAWTIDFFGIGKGDKFMVCYKQAFVEDKPINKIEIVAANFVHSGHSNYSFSYCEDKKDGYFDEEGNSLQKTFLKAPLKYSRISSRFSNRRFHPVLKRYRAHHGIDYAAPTGTPVLAIGDGLVVKKGYQRRGGGRYVKIKHNSVYTTTYMHFSRFGKGIRPGVRVKQGQVIGYVGASGLATGPHLDFRVFKNGKAINPLSLKAPSVAPVKKENMKEFMSRVDLYKSRLDLYSMPAITDSSAIEEKTDAKAIN
ncbi:MAG: peptidoglycan DD-metalloendopeptidase family protein [Marinifilaceae bacterium]|jgi:murein DD-endopeptidase MepM/ murein hydrolase activator NlpD|nr:peptidoglycan DD-metalloendopeptidase family protein [Marinifilaceae bacterium]